MPAVRRQVASTALEMLRHDIETVISGRVMMVTDSCKANIVMSLDSSLPHEGFRLNVRKGKLHVAGADEHGLAYGMLELSRKMGVSPWEYWADCTVRTLDRFVLKEGFAETQHPAVAYRGIFINDEDWGLNPWATRQEPEAWTLKQGRIKGAIGPKVNEKIFQLLLRLRANYYWPAMHECSQPFFTIAGNREMAAKYGIYIGGSHCEPMATSPAAEWELRGNGEYNYVTNREAVQDFWRERIREVHDQEIVYTIGMRGVHDGAMQGVKTDADKLTYLQMVIDDQRQMLARTTGRDVRQIPQVFVPYKEVLDIYRSGLQVPEDVTLMWTDDNYGYIRYFPTALEQSRTGGNGLYYHASYWGRPHDYLWLNSMPLGLMENQLMSAYQNGIRRIWVLNVGDIKPAELQIEDFMDIAWNGTPGGMEMFKREFGDEAGGEIISIMQRYMMQTALCKPEFMAGTRVEEADRAYWNTVRSMPGDWDKYSVKQRVECYQDISDRVEELYSRIPQDRKDAFFQLVKYPVQAAAQMSFKFLCPERCQEAYDSIQSLTRIYNTVCAAGKWNGIISASPRNLPVFQRVTAQQLPQYPDRSPWTECYRQGDEFHFSLPQRTDSVTLQIRLLPTHPIQGDTLAFAVRVDDGRWIECCYQTYGRSEEWKQNVLRGYAQRTIRVPVARDRDDHVIGFRPLTAGVTLWEHQPFSFLQHTGI